MWDPSLLDYKGPTDTEGVRKDKIMKVKVYTDSLQRPDVQASGKEEFWISVKEMEMYGVRKVVIEIEETDKSFDRSCA